MHHPNFWIVAVAFFPPMLVLYLIRRYQHLSQTKLSKRQVREPSNAARAGRGMKSDVTARRGQRLKRLQEKGSMDSRKPRNA